MAHRPIITLTTDFGLNDHFVGTVKGVILNILPEAEIVDICHSVDPFDVLDGALTIAQAYSYFPVNTVHLVVVDPGVGTERRVVVATTERQHFVAPDNGVLSFVSGREERMQVHHVTAGHYYLQPVSQTFHARDIFAPIAAYLAKGVALAKFGEEIHDFMRLAVPRPTALNGHTVRGTVLKVDHFGNLITNITPHEAPLLFQPMPSQFKIKVGGREIAGMKNSYASGMPGALFGILGSMGYLEIVANRGSAFEIAGVGKGANVDIELEGAAA